ncbi:MAG: hypothetical protein JNK48_15300 [Bryobacterales bacterium]|nr:hypothetical protein [Bryobacterales bacterium]
MRRRTLLQMPAAAMAATRDWELSTEQLTFGPEHHFFGYIGHVQNTPWNASGRYMAALRTGFQDRMPEPVDAADVVLIDTRSRNADLAVERTRAWNFQQGTMFYWNPRAQETQLLFNDRDVETNHVFPVLFDVARRKRIREYRFKDTPFGNGGVAQNGGWFAAINYGRMARLRPVTGYPKAFDWNAKTPAPDDDGVFVVEIATGRKRLLVSFRQLAEHAARNGRNVDGQHLFINHTLWSRDSEHLYFFLRADFEVRGKRVDLPFTIRRDGSGLTMHEQHIGGHPEWEYGNRMIGDVNGEQILYDVEQKKVVEVIGGAQVFPNPGGDVALSADGKWFVNGYRRRSENFYIVYRRADRTYAQTKGFPHPGKTGGELRVDAAPCWNRTGDRIAFPAIAEDGTRQMFAIRVDGKRS